MARAIDPENTSRAPAFALRMNAPNPMATFFKTFYVTGLVKAGKKKGLRFNMQ